MTGPSTDEPFRSFDEVHLTDVIFFEEGSSLSDAALDPLIDEMGAAWRRGERPSVEDVLAGHPALADNADAVLRLVCEEICLREETGVEVRPDEFLRRFPRWQAEVQSLLDCRQLMRSRSAGEINLERAPTLSDFKILAELGEGAQGQVYLATQPALADRPFVLKITRCHGEEHRALARLQHTHIVPLYWAQDEVARDRRILCMPYFGNVTLGDLFKALKDKPPGLRTGKDVLSVLENGRMSAKVALPANGPARQFLARASYVEAVCWMGACLADALHYAHERGLLHLDIKPTNVLLAADGQPMLLDFHLARGPIRPDSAPPRGMGGTPYFMSPEQQLAMEAVCAKQPVKVEVDGRSDVYSLGLVLYQALSGQVPMQSPPPRLDECNPRVSVGLADVVQKCLAREPRGRYRDAAKLASDLRRHLGHLPLKGVPNRSWHERWGKWRTRKPHALAISLLVAVLLLTCASVGWYVWTNIRQQTQEIDNALANARILLDRRQYEQAIEKLESGQAVAVATPGGQGKAKDFAHLMLLAKHGRAVQTLHGLVDRLRFLPGAEDYSPEGLRHLEEQCQIVWETRDRLLRELESDPKAQQLRGQLRTDLLDLALISTELRFRLAPGKKRREALREAQKVLDEAEKALQETSPVLEFERQVYKKELGEETNAGPMMPPRTTWEFYTLGRSYLQRKDYETAMSYLNEAVAREPRGFWQNFYQGVCAYRRKEYSDAVAAFRACVTASAGMPDGQIARCYYNRALAEAARGRKDRAMKDYTEALGLDEELAVAALNRGILFFEQKKYDKALSDLQTALAKGCDPLAGNYNLAQVYQAMGNRTEAVASVRRALDVNPRHAASRELLALLEATTPQ